MRSRLQIAAASFVAISALVAPASVAADTTGGGGAGTFDAVQVMQAAGKGVATGSGYNSNVACDGVAHTYLTGAVTTTVPFHGGSAVASASASVCGTLADYTYACTDVSAPWVTIKVAG